MLVEVSGWVCVEVSGWVCVVVSWLSSWFSEDIIYPFAFKQTCWVFIEIPGWVCVEVSWLLCSWLSEDITYPFALMETGWVFVEVSSLFFVNIMYPFTLKDWFWFIEFISSWIGTLSMIVLLTDEANDRRVTWVILAVVLIGLVGITKGIIFTPVACLSSPTLIYSCLLTDSPSLKFTDICSLSSSSNPLSRVFRGFLAFSISSTAPKTLSSLVLSILLVPSSSNLSSNWIK